MGPDPSPSAGSFTLEVVSVFSKQPWQRIEDGSVLERVELPAWFTLEARPDEPVSSVEFLIDGESVRVDESAPYYLSEDADGPTRWEPALGAQVLTLVLHSSDGALPSSSTFSFQIGGTGLDTSIQFDDGSSQQWSAQDHASSMQQNTFASGRGLQLPYRLFTPPRYDDGVQYPLLVYLHGRGERGSDNRQQIYSNSALFTGQRSILSANGQRGFPAFVLVPQCSSQAENEEWARWEGSTPQTPFNGLDNTNGSYMQAAEASDSGAAALELVEHLLSEFSIDPDRVYITGESMGGFGSWEFTSREPELFAAGAPMAGYSDKTKVDRVKHIPFWVFHGGSDNTNPVAGSRQMSQALLDAGATVIYTEYAGVDHSPAFSRAWNTETELLPWIFSQRRAR